MKFLRPLSRSCSLRVLAFNLLVISLLSACSKVDAPTPGHYRAAAQLRGGEAPFELQINEQNGHTVLGLVRDGELLPASNVTLQDGKLQAQLPAGAGTLQATMSRRTLSGELQLTDQQGKPQILPFTADLDRSYRFVAKPSTDNADVSGYWRLQADPEVFAMPTTLQLQQRFDAVDGELRLADGQTLSLWGQVNGDEVYWSILGQGRAVLFKGKVNKQGELDGELWANLSDAQSWQATRMTAEQADAHLQADEQVRKVALPWTIPAE